MIEKVKRYAVEHGYNDVKKIESWKGYDIYEPLLHDDAIIGIPLLIMVKGNKIRMSTIKEAFDYMDRK